MAYEPTDADLRDYQAAYEATKTPVIVAPGPRPQRKSTPIGGASRGVLFWGTLGGVPRIIVTDDEGPVVELTRSRVASADMQSQFLSADATVEVAARREGADDGAREYLIIAGPKKALRTAFESIGCPL